MRNSRRHGFTLIEFILAVSMGSIVIGALYSLMTMLVQSQVYSARSQTVQLNLMIIDKLVNKELRQATLLTQPSVAGTPSAVLEGCGNASGAPPAPIDTNSPMRWFAICSSAGTVYYHTGAGCPASYFCGTSPTAAFAWGFAPQAWLNFTRPSMAGTLVTTTMKASNQDASAQMDSAVAFSAPAGGAQ